MATTYQHGASAADVLDPVCGMTISRADAVGHIEHKGQTYHFCSEQCLERFRATPDAFVTGGVPERPTTVPGATYICPMDPDVRQSHPGACPKCGMALEPDLSTGPAMRVEYTCPMHPEIGSRRAGLVPDLRDGARTAHGRPRRRAQPRTARHDTALPDRRIARRTSVLPAMGDMVLGMGLGGRINVGWANWLGLALATPVVWWAGWPFFARGWASIVNRSPNMFTLIALGVGAAYAYSAAATLIPGVFPEGFRMHGVVETYFDTAVVITVLVLLGQLLELRARSQTSAAI